MTGNKTINQNVIENIEAVEKMPYKKCVGLVKKYQQDVKDIPELFSEAKIVIQFLIDLSLEQYQNFLIDVKYNLITS